jgi:hypothetical protein
MNEVPVLKELGLLRASSRYFHSRIFFHSIMYRYPVPVFRDHEDRDEVDNGQGQELGLLRLLYVSANCI